MVNGVDGSTILKDSKFKGTAPGGTFYFDEFLNAIRRDVAISKKNRNPKPWEGSTGIGKNLNPSVDDAVQGIQNTENQAGKYAKYPTNVGASKLFPTIYGPEVDPGFANLFGRATDLVQENRKKASAKGLAGDFQKAVDGATEASEGMHAGRSADLGDRETKSLNTFLQQEGIDGVSLRPEAGY